MDFKQVGKNKKELLIEALFLKPNDYHSFIF